MASSNSGNQSSPEKPNKSFPTMVASVVTIAVITISCSACTKVTGTQDAANNPMTRSDYHDGAPMNPVQTVVVADSDLKAGDRFTNYNLIEKSQKIDRIPEHPASSLSVVVGHEVQTDIKSGTIVTQDHVGPISPFRELDSTPDKFSVPQLRNVVRGKLVFALKDIPAGGMVFPYDLEVRDADQSKAPPDAISDLRDAGSSFKKKMSRGQIVRLSDFETYAATISAKELPKGSTISQDSLEVANLFGKRGGGLDMKELVGRIPLCDIPAGYQIKSEYLEAKKGKN